MARLSIRLLGSFQVSLDGQPITAFESDKERASGLGRADPSKETHCTPLRGTSRASWVVSRLSSKTVLIQRLTKLGNLVDGLLYSLVLSHPKFLPKGRLESGWTTGLCLNSKHWEGVHTGVKISYPIDC